MKRKKYIVKNQKMFLHMLSIEQYYDIGGQFLLHIFQRCFFFFVENTS